MILKPSMVISGKACPQQASVDEVAEATFSYTRAIQQLALNHWNGERGFVLKGD